MTCPHCTTKLDVEKVYKLTVKHGEAKLKCPGCKVKLTITMGMDGKVAYW